MSLIFTKFVKSNINLKKDKEKKNMRKRTLRRTIGTWRVTFEAAVRTAVNNQLNKVGLFLTDNNRLSVIIGSTDMLTPEAHAQIGGFDEHEALKTGTVLKDLASGNLWVLCGWEL